MAVNVLRVATHLSREVKNEWICVYTLATWLHGVDWETSYLFFFNIS